MITIDEYMKDLFHPIENYILNNYIDENDLKIVVLNHFPDDDRVKIVSDYLIAQEAFESIMNENNKTTITRTMLENVFIDMAGEVLAEKNDEDPFSDEPEDEFILEEEEEYDEDYDTEDFLKKRNQQMPKTIRQRKEELNIAIDQAKINLNTIIPTTNLLEEYKKILTDNMRGIKNTHLIETQLNRLMALNLPKAAMYSNLKFLQLFRSRLTEEGIPLLQAEYITEHVDFNMNEVNEDDDYIGDVALRYAELCKKQYDRLGGAVNLREDGKAFNLMPVCLPPA